ncbi:MAG TPA: hypothetical protein VNY55_07555, partial [Mycobacterium sp.]|nr:hypothetical protein [Mycobacterium sp.]
LLPRFETISYREWWDRVVAVASALVRHLGMAGRPFVCWVSRASTTTMEMALVQGAAATRGCLARS